MSYSLPASVQAQTSAQPRTSEAPSGAPQKTLVTPTVTYEYDGAYNRVTGRVVRMAYPNGQRMEADYADNAGDRRMLTLRNVDPGNGTLSKFDYEYEKEGNIVAWSRQLGNAAAKTKTYGCNAAHHLVEATLTAVVKGTRRSEFFYDGLGRRVRMVEREGATTVSDRRYIWDGGEIVEERDGANTSVVTKRYFGAGVQEVAAQATTNLFYSRDHLGSVREVTDANGNLVARYDYDAWGRQTQVFGTYRADWGYAGYFVHRASKLNLTWYRAYDPDLGRWVSRDPIAEQGGLNLYGYVENNPMNDTDPNGLYGNKGRKRPRFPRPKWVDKYSNEANPQDAI